MKIYWFGAKSISRIEKIPPEEAQKIWDRACFEARNLKSVFAGLVVIVILLFVNNYLGAINFGDASITIFWQLLSLVIALIILANINFIVANYKVSQYFKQKHKMPF